MSESNDKELHDLVRQQLADHQMPYHSEDWEIMLIKLKRKRRWRAVIWFAAFMGIGLIAGISWFQRSHNSIKTLPPITQIQRPTIAGKKTASAKKENRNFSEQVIQTSKHSIIQKSTAITPALVDGQTGSNELRASSKLSLEILPAKPIQQPVLPVSVPVISVVSPQQQDIKQQMLTGNYGPDSTSYQVLARNINRWNNSVLVCDFTSSMYPYSTQLFAWFRQHARNPSIKGMVFFTDCDSLGNETTPNGPKGKMYVSREFTAGRILPLLLDAAGNTANNKDIAENDIEALIAAQHQFPEAKQLVLIADNSSPVKDMHRLKEVKKPVRIVICGTTRDTAQAFQPDFYTIAQRTNGSLHTLEDDFAPKSVTHRTWIKIGARYYWYNARREKFVVSRFRERPAQVFGLFWF